MTNTATAETFTANYLAARKAARRPGATLTERGEAQKLARKVAAAARRAGVKLDEIALDEQARVELYG